MILSIAAFLVASIMLGAHIANASTTAKYPVCHSGYCYTHPAVLSNAGPWAAVIAPTTEYFGQGGAPYLTGLRWPTYKHGEAIAKGRLHAITSGCKPTYQCRYHVVKVKWVLTRPKWCSNKICGGGWYYTLGHMTWKSSLKLASSRYWHTTSRGFWTTGK
jgi:hypothetical protein